MNEFEKEQIAFLKRDGAIATRTLELIECQAAFAHRMVDAAERIAYALDTICTKLERM